MKFNNDDAIQAVFTTLKNVRWRDCEENSNYEWYYAEDRHYVIHNKDNNAYWFVKGGSPSIAYEVATKNEKY